MKLAEIDRFLLGDNPFIGVSHLSQERSRQRLLGLDLSRILNVIQTALENGAQGLAFSTHPTMYKVLSAMRERQCERTFGIYPVIPDASAYVRLASERGASGLSTDILGRLGLAAKVKTVARGAFSALTFDVSAIMRRYIDSEIEGFLKVAPSSAELRAVFVHELICDTLLAFKHADLLQEYIDSIRDMYQVRAGLVTRNFSRLLSFLKEADFDLDCIAILTPFNKAGFQMNPTKEECEMALDQIEGAKVLAMSTLAAGYLNVHEATDYLKTKPRLHGFVVGVSSPEHARETFHAFLNELSPNSISHGMETH